MPGFESGYAFRRTVPAYPPRADNRQVPPALPPGRGHPLFQPRPPLAPGCRQAAWQGSGRSQWLIACERPHRSRSRIDHEWGLADTGFRRRKVVRTARTSGHGCQVPTRDQPREACQARPTRAGRQLIRCTHGSQELVPDWRRRPATGAPFAYVTPVPPATGVRLGSQEPACLRPLRAVAIALTT